MISFRIFLLSYGKEGENLSVENNVKAYLLVWLKHHILNTIKEQQIRRKYQDAAYRQKEEADDYTWMKIASEDLKDKLRAVVGQFPPRLKTVYILSREQNLSIKEIAEKLDVSEQTVKNQLSDILRRLKKEMSNKNFIFFI